LAEPRSHVGVAGSCPLDTEKLTDLILAFVVLFNEPMGIHLYRYQRLFMREIIHSLLDHNGATLTGLWSRQSGKSEALSSLAPALCVFLPALAKAFPGDPRLTDYTEGFWVGIFAPRLDQSGIIYGRIRSKAEKPSSLALYQDNDIGIQLTQSRGDQVSWSNGSFVASQTASEQSSVEGKTYHLVILDEAQLISRTKVNKEIAPMLAATNGLMVKIGTASFYKGGFHDSIVYNLSYEKKTGRRYHFEFPYDVVIEEKRRTYEETKKPFHLNYEAWVSTELAKLGGNKDNEEFRMNFRLMWFEANTGAIDRDAFYDAAIETLEANQPTFRGDLVAGLDYGKKHDATILTIMSVNPKEIVDTRAMIRPGDDIPVYHEKTIIAWFELEGRRWKEIQGKVVAALSEYAVHTLVADSTGVGDPLTEQLQDLIPSIRVIPFVLSAQGNDLMYKLYIQEMEAGRLKYAAGPDTAATKVYKNFVHEHEQLQKLRNNLYIKCCAPEGEHDDYPDSAALCCYAATVPRESFIEQTQSPFKSRRSNAAGRSRSDRYR